MSMTADQKEELPVVQQPEVVETTSVNVQELEQKMVEKEQQADPTGTAADKAAAYFQMSVPVLKSLVKQMSLRECQRVIMNVATYPLVKDYWVKRDSIEFQTAYRFNEMIMYKTVMQLEFEQQKALEAMEQNKKEENLSFVKGEIKNDEQS